MSIFEAATLYKSEGTPTIVLAGADYGMGSSRDWAAKGTHLLSVRAVIAQSLEIIHRSNLIGMGVLPLQFKEGQGAQGLGLTGREFFNVRVDDGLRPGQDVQVEFIGEDGGKGSFTAKCRLDAPIEVEYYRHGGILHMVLREFLNR